MPDDVAYNAFRVRFEKAIIKHYLLGLSPNLKRPEPSLVSKQFPFGEDSSFQSIPFHAETVKDT